MKSRSPCGAVLAVLLAAALAVPPHALAQAAQRAGEVTRVVPTASIQRAGRQLAAAAQSPVFWQDVVATDRGGRARVALDDGSVLNVGSESSLTITRHDANTQQTELDLAYGRVRANVVRLARPGAKFEVKTRTAVAGVVGTDFFLSFLDGITQLIVFEGVVQFCSLAGVCVTVGAGQTSFVRGNNPPDQPVNVSQSASMQAGQATQVTQAAAAGAVAGLTVLTVVAAVAAVVVPVVVANAVTRDDGSDRGRCCP
jgi:hypothetical protein